MKRLLVFLLYFVITVPAHAGVAVSPLVDVDWIKANGGDDGVVILDARGPNHFRRGHIPGAVSTDYGRDGWRVTNANGVPGMFPIDERALARLTRLVGGLGIDNESHVVIVSFGRSASDIGIATRIYWTFKVLGHDRVSILDGGMASYTRAEKSDRQTPANPLATGPARAPTKTFIANLRPEMLIGRDAVAAAMRRHVPLLDARPNLEHIGLKTSSDVNRPGTLPGATGLPAQWMTENGGGTFRQKESLAQLYAIAGAPAEGEQITFCNTGHWASVVWFTASEILGNKQVKLYDGSLAEWSRDPDAPMQRKIEPSRSISP